MMANAWNYSFTGDYPTKLNALLVYYQVKADDSTSIDKGKLAKVKKGMTKKAFTTFKEQAEHGRKITSRVISLNARNARTTSVISCCQIPCWLGNVTGVSFIA